MTPYYEDSAVTIYHGDCREMLPLPADCIVTDPPYGTGWVRAVPGTPRTTFSALRERAEWDEWSTEWLRDAPERIAVFCPDYRIPDLAAIRPEFRLRYYVKTNPRPPAGGEVASVEPIFVSPKVLNPGLAHFSAYNSRGGFGHPAAKPLDLLFWLVAGMSNPGQLILDPFAGVGTTLRAAKDLGRRAIGIEIDEGFCETAARRMEQETLPLAAEGDARALADEGENDA